MPEESKAKKDHTDTVVPAIITAFAVIAAALIADILAPIIVPLFHNSVLTLTPTALMELPSISTFTPPVSATLPPTASPSSTPYVCPFEGKTDEETIINSIQEEAVAANTKNLSIILAIFDPQAIFYDYSTKPTRQWNGPIARYQDDLFKATEFQGVEHFDISPVGPGINGDTAYFVSGSKGSYRIADGSWVSFFNGSLRSTPSTQFGSEHWLLKKNNNGCWVIVQMGFNAGHVEFPGLP